MNHSPKKAILAVSFGTSFEETRKKTIGRIEDDIRRAFPDYSLYRAWSSKIILNKLLKRDNIHICNVKEAMEQMKLDGVTDLTVQPTYVIRGIEYDLMKKDILSYGESFHHISFGAPLLTSDRDKRETVEALMAEWDFLSREEVLVLMGHGTAHKANDAYESLNDTFREMGYPNVFLGAAEARPSIESLLAQVLALSPKKIHLAPFLIAAGNHARNDMAGNSPGSWYSRFAQSGVPVECYLKGLGEYEGIRRIFLRHIAESRPAIPRNLSLS